MTLQPGTRALLAILHAHPLLRWQIRASPNQTLLYSGSFFRPIWKEIADFKRSHPELASKETLPDVLARLPVPGTTHPYPSLLQFVLDVEQPWQPDGFIIWRALSGIFASNAVGSVSFQIGSGVGDSKVFAATEVPVLLRNPNVDAVTKDLLAYFQRCIRSRQPNVDLGFISR
jgi:hypothetical protein